MIQEAIISLDRSHKTEYLQIADVRSCNLDQLERIFLHGQTINCENIVVYLSDNTCAKNLPSTWYCYDNHPGKRDNIFKICRLMTMIS
jgi:hypothetical protein